MKPVRPRHMFRYWTSRLALLAMLALAVMPTAGRLYASASGNAVASHVAMGADADGGRGHADHRGHTGAATDPSPPAAPAPAHQGHGDCPYCPLLGQLVGTDHPPSALAAAPTGPAPSLAASPGHASRRPHGLYARGPPATA